MLPFRSLAAIVTVAFVGGLPALAHAQLNVLCSAPADACKLLVDEFQKETNIRAMLVSPPRGAFPTLAEQKGNPQSDVWFGGPAHVHYRAAKFELLDAYSSPTVTELQPWAQKVAEQSKAQSIGVYARVVGIGYNTALATQKKLAPPACWKDLAKPGYAGQVHISDPKRSAPSYLAIAGMSQIAGEEQAFKDLKAMYLAPPPAKHGRGASATKKALESGAATPAPANPAKGGNTVTLTRSGAKGDAGTASASDAGDGTPPVGNALAGIGYMGDIAGEAERGAPVKAVAPCEGTVYEVGAVSIVKGAKNLANAKKFVDWTLSAKAQALVVKASRVYPANSAAASSQFAPKFSEIKFIDSDIGKLDKSAMRKQLLERWNKDVAAASP